MLPQALGSLLVLSLSSAPTPRTGAGAALDPAPTGAATRAALPAQCPPCPCAAGGTRALQAAPGPRQAGAAPRAQPGLAPLRRSDREVQPAPADAPTGLTDPFMQRPWPRNERPAQRHTVLRPVL